MNTELDTHALHALPQVEDQDLRALAPPANPISLSALLELRKYALRFENTLCVVKYGGSFMDDQTSELRGLVAQDLDFLKMLRINPVVVHGGGKAITRALEERGIKANFIQGYRVTDVDTVAVVEEALMKANQEIVESINALGRVEAVGFSGTEIFTCRKRFAEGCDGAPIDLGFVGEITAVNLSVLAPVILSGKLPVVSPTALSTSGEIYNCNADHAAAEMAKALQAMRLIFMSDVPGLMRDPKDPSTVISELRPSEVRALQEQGVIDKGMIPKVEGAISALNAHVQEVSFVDGRVPHSILMEVFSDIGQGTMIRRDEGSDKAGVQR